MKQSLQLKLGQQLTMTPQLQQAIRLLQLSTLDLQQEIQEALDSNPMLEVSEDNTTDTDTEALLSSTSPEPSKTDTDTNLTTSADNTTSNPERTTAEGDNTADSSSAEVDANWDENIPTDLPVDTSWDDVYQPAPQSSGAASDDYDFESRRSSDASIDEHLMWQLNLTPMSDRDRAIAITLIDAVGSNGFLSSSIDDICDGLEQQLEELERDEVVAVQHRLQQFDPIGMVSQDLSECLLVQLSQYPPETPHLAAAKLITEKHLKLVGSRDYRTLMRKGRLKEAELSAVIQLIQSLDPSPGASITPSNTEYIVPDVFVRKHEGHWSVELNPDIAPKLRINADYASMVKRSDSSADNTFLRDNLQDARWFLKSLHSRNDTLLKVATCIVEKQRGFLEYGDSAMKALVLHDIAEIVDMHESTISRVTTQKYIHTPQGIFELKYFFSSHVSTDTGGECSSTAIRALIKQLIADENPKKPLSDNKMATLLAEQGIKVARRTVAKYREAMNIAPSNERKELR